VIYGFTEESLAESPLYGDHAFSPDQQTEWNDGISPILTLAYELLLSSASEAKDAR
jgi:hypothetical protein